MNVLRSLWSYQRTPAGATNFAPGARPNSGMGVTRVGRRWRQREWLQWSSGGAHGPSSLLWFVAAGSERCI